LTKCLSYDRKSKCITVWQKGEWSMSNRTGMFLISLDFELYWGVRDKRSIEEYRENLLGARKVIPHLLELFARYDVHATWAAVGFLFHETKEELLRNLPEKKPSYEQKNLCPYFYLEHANDWEEIYHLALPLIKQISVCPGQRVGTHTFSHFYCLEDGQDKEAFRHDIQAAVQAAKRVGLELKSIVFPRNQVNQDYLSVCMEHGILIYRGNETSWLYSPAKGDQQCWMKRGIRLIDAYLNLSGHHCYDLSELRSDLIINLPSSRFLRPYSRKWRWLEPLRLKRIGKSMRHAAKHGLMYHLWWHPHNFGVHMKENLRILETILGEYSRLRHEFGFESLSMEEAAEHFFTGQGKS
jgi:peptidoglycan/xylan/chitin deacetylase (PgdA/CDA1 family)